MRWRERRMCRNLPTLSICGILFTASLIYFGRLMLFVEETVVPILPDLSSQDFFVNTSTCQIPAWDPWEDSVRVFFEPKSLYQCTGQPSFLRALPNSVITLDEALLHYYYEVDPKNVSCVFQDIRRDMSVIDENTDNRIIFSNFQKLIFDKPLGVDFVKTTCNFTNHLDRKVLTFEEFLPLTPLKKDVEWRATRLKEKWVNKPMNVIFLGLDSISHLNFLRHFPKCRNFFSHLQELNISSVFNMKGYTKVGDNTFPNIMPLLTGHFSQHYYNEIDNKTMFFDDVDFIWKTFSNIGFRTLFAEDAPHIATFNYYRSGFKRSPADYYYRPFAIAVERSEVWKNSKSHCLGNKMEMQLIYDYLKNFADTLGTSRPFFAFVFLARLTHDVLNYAGYADEPTYRLLKYFEDTKILENTMLVFFSDHGIRYGDIRKTYIGQFEERMPFMNLLVPKGFLRKHPAFEKNLLINSQRLTTPFDIHETLLHLSSIISGDTNLENDSKRGTSLFGEVPYNRTCLEASITTHWCPCQRIKLVSKTEFLVQKAAVTVIDSVNRKTSQYEGKCALLTLKDILSARVLEGKGNIPQYTSSESHESYLLTLSSSPGGAVFEATVQCDTKENNCRVIDDISRINKYGYQSICISSAEIRKFCYCIQ